MRRRELLALTLAATGVPSVLARAHPMPNSALMVEILPGSARLSALIPLSELDAAIGGLADGAAGEAQLRGYLAAHASIRGADGQPWTAELTGISAGHGRGHAPSEPSGEHPFLIAVLTYRPAAGASTEAKTLSYDAVNHRVASHYVLVYRLVGEEQIPLGRLQSPATELALP